MRPEDSFVFKRLADWQLMGLCIEREASGESRAGRIGVGTTILERVDHRDWDGRTVHEVVLKPWQYSWTMIEAGADYYLTSVKIASNWIDQFRTRIALQECCGIATGMLNKSIPRDPELAAAHCCQYLAAQLRRNMDRQATAIKAKIDQIKQLGTAPAELAAELADLEKQYEKIQKKRWWASMKLIKTIDHHEFYA